MSTKGRENWEKYKAGYVSTRLAEEVSTGNAGRDSWNELKKTIRFDKPESTQDVVSGSGAFKRNADYTQRVESGKSAYQSNLQQKQTDQKRSFWDYLGDAGRNGDTSLPTGTQTSDIMQMQRDSGKKTPISISELSKEQMDDFYYLYSTSPDDAEKYAKNVIKENRLEKYNNISERAGKNTGSRILASLESMPNSALSIADYLAQVAKINATGEVDTDIDPNASPSKRTQALRGGVSQSLAEKGLFNSGLLSGTINEDIPIIGGKSLGSAYELGMSMADSGANALLQGIPGALFMGGSAASSAFYDAMDRGATNEQAVYNGLAQGVAEALFEYVSLDKLIKMDVSAPFVKNALKQAGVEASEEAMTSITNYVTDSLIMKGKSEYNDLLREYGGDKTKAWLAMANSVAQDAVGGFISGGGMTLMNYGVNTAMRNSNAKEVYGDNAQDLVKESLELNPDNALATKLQKKLEAGKKLTGSELRQLVEQNEIDMVDGDRATIQTAAEARLTELGETENVPQVAKAIARQAAGERITDAEKTLLEGSERARQVRQELNPENIRVGATDEAWTGQIGTARVNRAAYNRGIQENGVTGAKYNAETGKLDAIVKDDQGKIKTVPAEKAELSPLQEELFDWATDLGEAGPVLVSAYRQTQNLETYARQFHNAYEYGKAGVPMDYVNKSQAVSYLNTTQREIAYEEGAKAHQRELQGRQEKKRSGGTVDTAAQKKPTVSLRGAAVGGVKYAPVNKKAMDGRQWASVGTMKAFAQATGVNVVFYESQANERGEYEGANGFYKNGTLYLDINAGRDRVAMGETAILKTAAHEITHYIKEGSPDQYEVLKNFVVEKLTREKGISFDDLVTDKQRREPGLSYEEAVDEVVADACEMMLKDSKAVEQLARENRSLAERIRQWIRKWVRSLKAAMEGLTADRPESRAMMQYAQELQEIWDNALVDAVRNGRGTVQENAPAEVKQQARVGTDEKSGKPIYQSNFPKGTPKAAKAQRILSLIQNVWSKKPISLVVQNADGSTRTIEAKFDPTYIEEEGVQTDAKKLMGGNRHGSASEQRVTLDLADDYYEIAAESTYNYTKSEMGKTSPTHKGVKQWHYFINDILFQEYGEKETTPYRVTINVKERSDGEFVYSFSAERQNERLSTRRTLHADDTQSARGGESNAQPSVDSIRQGNANSQVKSNDKVQNSMRDSVGRELTEAQQEYFKDSKVRDAEGNLLVMYRGGTGTKTVFTRERSRYSNLYGRGFYFTKDKDRASQYGGVREFYLNIQAPLSPGQNAITEKQMRKFLEAVQTNEDEYSFWNYGESATVDSVLRDIYGKGDFEMLQDVNATAIGDLVAAVELFNDVNGTNYDGIILPTETVTFASNQAKNIDNKNPTVDPDIRFSMREPVEETRDLIALHNMTLDNLRGALKLGGLPMPSIAIVKAKSGHDLYGPISLVFRKDTIDPQLFRSNKVYGYDAWTPTAPRIEYEVNEKAADKLRELYYRMQREKGRDFAAPLYSVANTLEDELNNKGGLDKVVDRMRDDTRIMQIYLEDTGAGSVENVMRKNVTRMSEGEIEMAQALTEKLGEKTIQSISAQTGESPFSARRRWFAKYGEAVNDALTAYYEQEGIPHEEALRVVEAETTANKIKSVLLARKYLNGNAEVITEEVNREATDKAIREKVDQDSYEQWLEGLFSGVVKNSGIYNGKDYYTASGNRRSFSATHYEVNLENIVRAMKQGEQTGTGTFFGGQAIWGVTAKDYRSIEEIKEDSGRLQKLSEEEYSRIRQQFTERLANITSEIMDKNNGNEFTASDDAASAIAETLRTKHTVKAIDKELRTYPTLRIQPDTAQKVFDLCRDISNMPTGYFEAKPQRAVGFDEVAAVVVPDNLPADLRKGLEQIGATVREYKAGDEQSRLEAVNADERVRFSLRSVPPVKPKNGGWERGATFDEVKTEHPTLFALDADESSTRNPTQISGTVKSYRKIFDALKEEGFDGTILDASSGLGYGTRLGREEYGYRVDDIEPFPDAKYKPRYTDYSALDNTYDAIISNAVLNVIPQDLRDAMVVKIGEMLNPGGRAFINVRGTDVKNASSKVAINESGMEYFISNTGSYQKGFTTKELVAYLRDALGDGFTVRATNKFGAVSAIVTKNEERVQSQQREPRLSDRVVLDMAAEMALRDQNKSWTAEDRRQLEMFKSRLRQLEYAQSALAALKEERAELLAGRKVSEIKGEERTELIQNRNRMDLAKKNVKKWEDSLWKLESQAAIKKLLRKSRITVEQETAFKARQRYREKVEDRQRYQVLKKRLERTTSEWKRMLLKPTKDRYAPEELVRSCLEVAMMLDESGPREGTKSKHRYETTSEALAYMKKQYDALENSEDQFYRLGYDKELSELVEQLKDALDGKAIRDLTYEEAGDVAAVLVSMQGILKEARYQIGSLERISTQELADGAVRQMLSAPERSKTEAATDAVARQSASVMRNIRRMVQYDENAALYKLFRQLEEGVKKKDRFIMDASKIFDRFAGERMLRSATELKTYHISGVDVNMTEMQVMQLILSAKRELSDKTRHLEGKGFIVPDLKLMRKGKGQDAISKGQELKKTFLKDILQLEDGLDAWAKDYMHTASEFFNGLARNAINEATVQTKHRRMAVTKDYVPYEVDKRTVVKDIDGVKFDATIEGDGMLKSVVAGAQNPLIIRGLNTIVENHIERVGRIYGLAVPIRNFNKAYNAKSQKGQGMSMKEAIDRAWPAADTKLIEQAITDLQTSRERATDDISKLMRKTEGKFVEATLLSNISVTIKQAASYSTAGLYLSQKALFPYQATIVKLFAADNSAFAKKLFAEIDEHTPMHYMRRKGMSMEEAATVAQDNSKVVRWMDKKLPDVANPLKWIQNMDVATTAAIWLATKRQVELDGVKQSDPTYWSRVTELYEKVISETQPMYDSLHRPEVQKNTNEVLRGLMMFRTQPLQNAGILYDAAGELAQARKNGDQEQIKAASRKFKMAVGSQVASLAVFATMTLLAYAVRNRLGRYRDDEEELTVASVMKRVLGDMAVNGAQLIAPIGGGLIAGGIEKVITGSSYGGTLSIPTLDAINDWLSQMDRVRQDIVKLSEDEEADIVTDSVDFAMDTAGVLGIPAKNAFGILRGIVGNITDISGHELSWATDKPDPSMAIAKACFENGHVEKGREVIDQVIQSKMDTGKDEKEARSAVRSSLTAYYKKLYLKAYKRKDNEEMKRIRLILQGSRMYDENAADVAAGWVKKWAEEEKKKEQAKKK